MPYIINGIQTVTLGAGNTGGTFTLTYNGQTTSGLAFNAAASAVQTALVALSNVGANDVIVTGAAGGPYTVVLTGALANGTLDTTTGIRSQVALTGTGSLTGGTNTVTVQSVAINAPILPTNTYDPGLTIDNTPTTILAEAAAGNLPTAPLQGLVFKNLNYTKASGDPTGIGIPTTGSQTDTLGDFTTALGYGAAAISALQTQLTTIAAESSTGGNGVATIAAQKQSYIAQMHSAKLLRYKTRLVKMTRDLISLLNDFYTYDQTGIPATDRYPSSSNHGF